MVAMTSRIRNKIWRIDDPAVEHASHQLIMDVASFHISIQVPVPIQPKAHYALQQLAIVLGIKLHLVDHEFPCPDAVYGDATQRCADCLWLPYDPDAYDASIKHKGHAFEGVKVWGPASATQPMWDLVGATFRLLSLLDESQVSEENRDDKGIFKVEGLPGERRLVLDELLVENHAVVLSRRLAAQRQILDEFVVPLWPQGKKWAFLLSHDTDAITLGSPLEMFANLLRGLIRPDATSLAMFKDGFAYMHRPNENPLFGFPVWRELEEPKFRSCFYLFVKPKSLNRHLNDCRSTVVEQKIDWGILREMAEAGWEFGLHAPIHAKQHVDALSWGKQFIEEKIGKPVFGLRHHYWALDWRNPHLTFRKHIDAGFRYDASIAWRDSEGFRAGTCFPFQPFDPDKQAAMPIYEVPTCLMDRHAVDAPHSSSESARGRALKLLHQIKARNGVAFLNWHTEAACNRYRYEGYVNVLVEVLRSLACDSEAWITTPRELVAWWSTRHQQLTMPAQ
jgi:hypothetical protein